MKKMGLLSQMMLMDSAYIFILMMNAKKHKWLIEYLQKYNTERHEVNIRNNISLISTMKKVILVSLFIVMTIIGTIFDLLKKCIASNTIAKAITKIFKK
jgi:hypothetical protein